MNEDIISNEEEEGEREEGEREEENVGGKGEEREMREAKKES